MADAPDNMPEQADGSSADTEGRPNQIVVLRDYCTRVRGADCSRCALACLFHLEQPCPARYAARLQGGRDGKADCLFRAASVRYHKVCRHGVKSMFQAFHRCVKRL